MTHSPLLQHINENIAAIEESRLLDMIKSKFKPTASALSNQSGKAEIGDLVHTSKVVGKIHLYNVHTTGIIFKDHTNFYETSYKFKQFKKTTLHIMGQENEETPDWVAIDKQAKFIIKSIPAMLRTLSDELPTRFQPTPKRSDLYEVDGLFGDDGAYIVLNVGNEFRGAFSLTTDAYYLDEVYRNG